MIGDSLTTQNTSSRLAKRNIPAAQEAIYQFLLESVKTWAAEEVLAEFKRLFICHADTTNSDTLPHLYEIVFANQEQEFRNTLKRSCYILINNWDMTRNYKPIQQLVQLFLDPILYKPTVSPTLKRLRQWLRNFIASSDFQELKLFASRYSERTHWSHRYTPYLLVPQYINLENPIEQRQAARSLARQLKEKFKFELAMYTALSECLTAKGRVPHNPTYLGDEVLRLIKKIVAKRGNFSYSNLANIFLNQTQTLPYREFKRSLQEYLIFSVQDQEYGNLLKAQLSGKLDELYADHNDKPINDALLLRTTNRVIEFLTTEDYTEPSSLFALLLSQGNPLTLVVLLLKLILICRYSHTHLEARIAELIKYYEDFSEEECQWVISFFEIFNITMTIYTENVEYSLVNMSDIEQPSDTALESYRIFSQSKCQPLLDS